ncbi:MAG: dienelactone hydrolase family protein [Rhodospirillaceae bacterium]
MVQANDVGLPGTLVVPEGAEGIVLFAHGSGSSRHSPRNVFVARILEHAGLGTLLFDLLTREEEAQDRHTSHFRFDIGLLAARLAAATEWVAQQALIRRLRIGYFGASTGSAAALIAAAHLGNRIASVVSRGGRADLAGNALPRVTSPTLLIVGGEDDVVIELNERAFEQMRCAKRMAIVPRATHLFEEPGTLQEAADLACSWFQQHLLDIVHA